MREEIGIFGSYPPPYGGMSVHVSRLTSLLAQHGISYRVYNGVGDFDAPPRVISVRRKRGRVAFQELIAPRHQLYYVLTTRTSVRVWAGLLAARKRPVVLRIGGQSLEWALGSKSWRQRSLTKFAVRNVWGVVGVNDNIARLACEVRGGENRVWSIPGFLRPSQAEREFSTPPPVARFTDSHQPLLLAMGRFCLVNGRQIYGVNMLIDLLARLRQDYPRAGMLYALTAHDDLKSDIGREVQSRIERAGLQGDFLIHPAGGPLVSLMEHADAMVRPTTTDGDSNAIREALWMGLPVVASDCVARPKAATIFSTYSLDDCEAKVRATLGDLQTARVRTEWGRPADNWPAIRSVFEQALERPITALDEGVT